MNKGISILYYSYAFLAGHGGRLHSEAFVKEARKSQIIDKVVTYPELLPKKEGVTKTKGAARKTLKKFRLFQILSFYRKNYHSYRSILPILRRKKVDCLHIRTSANFLIIKKLKRLYPDLLITTEVNGSPFDENLKNIPFRQFFRELERKSLQNADANFFVSGFLRNKMMGEVEEVRDFVVHNGVDLELFRSGAKKKQNRFTFGYIGTMDYHKEVKTLIDAFHDVYLLYQGKVELLIIGDGPGFKEIKSYVKQKNLVSAITFKGRITHDDVLENLYKLDVAIHHSAKPYMSPLKIFEYLAAGLPVIGPDTPAVKEVFKDGEDLILVSKESQDLSNKMIYLMKNPNKARAIANAGKKKVFSQYGWDRNVNKILSVIKSKLEEKDRKIPKNAS